jgi:hypothetical protein
MIALTLLAVIILNRTHRAVILGLTRIGFVLGWCFLIILGCAFISIVVLDWLMSLAFTASEAASVHKGVDGGARIGLVPEVEAVGESMEMEGGIRLTGLGLGFNTTVDLHK